MSEDSARKLAIILKNALAMRSPASSQAYAEAIALLDQAGLIDTEFGREADIFFETLGLEIIGINTETRGGVYLRAVDSNGEKSIFRPSLKGARLDIQDSTERRAKLAIGIHVVCAYFFPTGASLKEEPQKTTLESILAWLDEKLDLLVEQYRDNPDQLLHSGAGLLSRMKSADPEQSQEEGNYDTRQGLIRKVLTVMKNGRLLNRIEKKWWQPTPRLAPALARMNWSALLAPRIVAGSDE